MRIIYKINTAKTTSLTTPGDVDTKYTPDKAPALTDTELEDATKALSNSSFVEKFPRVDRNFADPPIHNQTYGLFSFIPAKGATPNEKGMFGFAKLRGNFATEDEASVRADEIIRTADSTHTIFHTYVGRPFPVTISENYSAETSEVDIRKDTTVTVSNAIKDKKAEDAKIAKEMKEQEAELMRDTDPENDPAVVEEDEYITLNIKKAQLSWTYLEHIKKMQEIRGVLANTKKEIIRIDAVRPELRTTFMEKYFKARTKAGLKHDEKDLREGFIKYLVEDVVLPGIDSGSSEEMDAIVMSGELPVVETVTVSGGVKSEKLPAVEELPDVEILDDDTKI